MPDVLCNREIKFDVFMKIALDLGADFVATGHYCRKSTTVIDGVETHHLLSGVDPNKDQSYFLCQLSQEQLAKTLFPIGELLKPKVREIAASQELNINALQNFVYEPNDGTVVGEHIGAHYFTKGQRKGLAVGGKPLPLFVLETDVKTNSIYVGQGKSHPGLVRKGLLVTTDEIHWVRPDLALKTNESLQAKARMN